MAACCFPANILRSASPSADRAHRRGASSAAPPLAAIAASACERWWVLPQHAFGQAIVDHALVGRCARDQAAGQEPGAETLVAEPRQARIATPNFQGLVAIERGGQ